MNYMLKVSSDQTGNGEYRTETYDVDEVMLEKLTDLFQELDMNLDDRESIWEMTSDAPSIGTHGRYTDIFSKKEMKLLCRYIPTTRGFCSGIKSVIAIPHDVIEII